jgi:outer membrane protein assembly factor BamA
MLTSRHMVKRLLIGVCLSGFISQVAAQRVVAFDTVAAVHVEVDRDDVERAIRPYLGDHKRKSFGKIDPGLSESLHAAGYMAAAIDTSFTNDTARLHVALGQRYDWNELLIEEDAEALLRKAGVNLNRLRSGAVSPSRLERAFTRALREAENTGFPFARIFLDSVQIGSDGIHAILSFDQGPLVKIDSVTIDGDLKVRPSYVSNYLGIKEGSLYSERAIERIPEKLSAIRFMTSFKPPEVVFEEEKTAIKLYLNKRNASSFDGIIGFLPDNVTGDLLVTGDVQLHLENTLKQGEVIDLNWRKLQTNTQELDLELISPYILNSAISLDGNLRIYRRDTLFTDVFRQLGVRYVFGSDDFIRLFVDRQTTSLISTEPYANATQPPPFLDCAITSYGVGFRWSRLDNQINPAKGFELNLTAAAGNKTIIENDNLPEVIYDSLQLSSLQLKATLDASYYLSFIPRLVWHQRAMGANLFNDQLFNNEAYRIGGLRNLRGVDEESIFATSYLIARSELRYQFDRQGYVFGFFDASWYENQSLNRIGAARDTPYATGLGITFGTKAGLFSLSYALGSQQGNPFLLRAAKIHFGFLSLF